MQEGVPEALVAAQSPADAEARTGHEEPAPVTAGRPCANMAQPVRRQGEIVVGGSSAFGARVGRSTAAVVCAAVLAAALTSCSSTNSAAKTTSGSSLPPVPQGAFNDHTGVTANSVNVANISTQTAGLFKGAAVGVEAYAAYVNSQGGIDGRKIIVNASDDQFTGATNKQLTEEAVQSDFATVGSFSTEDSFGGVVLAANPQMPNVSIALDPATQRLPNTFAAVPPAAFWPLGPLVYFKDKFPTKVLHTATIVADLPSTLNLWNYEKAAMDHVGYKVLYSPALPATTTDFTAQIVTMKDMGVQILFLEQEPQNYAASIFKDLDEQNFHPVVVLGTAAYSHQLIANSGGASNVDGAYLEQQEALFLGEDAPAIPAVATFNTWVQKVSPGFHHRLLHPPGMARRGALRTRPPQRGVEPEQRFVAGGTPQGHLVQRQRTGADQQSCAENPEWLLHHRTGGPRNLPTARRPADRRANPWVPL